MTQWIYEQDLISQKYRILISTRHDRVLRQIGRRRVADVLRNLLHDGFERVPGAASVLRRDSVHA
mgnify:CR=1 FL=1